MTFPSGIPSMPSQVMGNSSAAIRPSTCSGESKSLLLSTPIHPFFFLYHIIFIRIRTSTIACQALWGCRRVSLKLGPPSTLRNTHLHRHDWHGGPQRFQQRAPSRQGGLPSCHTAVLKFKCSLNSNAYRNNQPLPICTRRTSTRAG